MDDVILVNPDVMGFEQGLGALEQAVQAIRREGVAPELALQAAANAVGD
jgi:hypothetical protein